MKPFRLPKFAWKYLDKHAHLYERNPLALADWIKEMDKMTHLERLKLVHETINPQMKPIVKQVIDELSLTQ